MRGALEPVVPSERAVVAWALAAELADEDVAQNRFIGQHGLSILGACAR
jgi:methylthioribose-1-phosphate isomerase